MSAMAYTIKSEVDAARTRRLMRTFQQRLHLLELERSSLEGIIADLGNQLVEYYQQLHAKGGEEDG